MIMSGFEQKWLYFVQPQLHALPSANPAPISQPDAERIIEMLPLLLLVDWRWHFGIWFGLGFVLFFGYF